MNNESKVDIQSDEVLMDFILQLRDRYFYARNNYTYPHSEHDIEVIKQAGLDHGIPEFIITSDPSFFEKLKHKLRDIVTLTINNQ